MDHGTRIIEYYDSKGDKYQYDTTIRDDTEAGHPVKMTSFHTVIDPRWGLDYVYLVQETERETGHEICGAETKDNVPCRAYPLKLEEELYSSEIGRCKHHRPSMNEMTDLVEVAISESRIVPVKSGALTSPLARSLMEIAVNEFFMVCEACVSREYCDEAGENNGRCIKEKRLFESLLVEMINSYDLDSIADYFTSISVVDTMIKIIRTSAYEAQYGIVQSLESNTANYNMHLKKLLNSTLKTLGVDRKTRISIKRSGGKIEAFEGSIAKALSSVKIDKVEMKTATVKMSQKRVIEDIGGRTGPPVGMHGQVIKDDEPIET
jgi:hypothetical protein